MDFVRALKENDIAECKVALKSDLHNHIDLGGDYDYIAQRASSKMPLIQPKDRYDGVSGMDNQFLKDFLPKFPESKDLIFLWNAALIEAYNNGVYNLSPDIGKCAKHKFNGSLEAGIKAFYETAHNVYRTNYSMLTISPIITLKRGTDPKRMDALLDEAIACGYFKGIDLIGSEEHSPEQYSSIFEKAHKSGMTCMAHIGEYSDPMLVIRYIEALDLDAIMHGITAVNSREAIELIRKRRITLHLCPTSNVKLGYVKSYAKHPIKQFINNKINVTINTDDRLIFGSSITEEYIKLYTSGCLSAEELDKVRLDGLGFFK
jgi:adenosine deaminase